MHDYGILGFVVGDPLLFLLNERFDLLRWFGYKRMWILYLFFRFRRGRFDGRMEVLELFVGV